MVKFNLNRVKAERIAQGKTQLEVAESLGWTRNKYVRVENGKYKLGSDELAQIASVLGVPDDNMKIFFTSSVDKLERTST